VSPFSIGLTAFICVVSGALVGMFLGRILPDDHLSADTKDVIKVAMAMIATLAALVLGLMTASASNSLESKETEMKSTATQILLLDRTLAKYGEETHEARALLKTILRARINEIWLEENNEIVEAERAISRDAGVDTVQVKLLELSPQNDTQRWLKSAALQITNDIAAARWSLFEQVDSRVKWPLLAAVVLWLAVIFTSFGLFAPHNSSVAVALVIAALSVAGSIYLILEMDQPYSGPIQISSAPLRAALEQLGRP
jgi:hypothetical protein